MSKPFLPTAHPVLGLPTATQAAALGEARWRELMIRREEIIRGEKADAFRNCWEPPIWKVADAIMGFPWVEAQWAERMRKHLGFEKPAPVLLVNGGNRGSKSQWASNRVMRVLHQRPGARAWALHSTLKMSQQYQQPLFYNYLPQSLKAKDIKSKTTYIAYKQKTGFSEEQFVLPPVGEAAQGSDCVFKMYEQERQSIEGGNLDIVWPDELVPADWIETLEFRIAEKNGWMPITFTPVEGYSPTVKLFQDGAEIVKESVAFLLPKDGQPADPARALGLTEEQFAEVQAAQREGRAALFPQSVPEDCNKWIEEGTGLEVSRSPSPRPSPPGEGEVVPALVRNPVNSGQMAIPEGREFETVPRVMRCVDEKGKRAVVFFYSSDNPYGNPKEIWNFLSGKPADFVKERFYGFATKQQAGRFPKFNLKVHTCAPAAVPAVGTNYQFIDPCSGRNFYMLWIRVTPEQVFVYREWPGPYYIEGVGVPGPWALPDPKKPDGKMGPAQETFGWGYRAYKLQIAQLEKWKDVENAERGTRNAERGGGLEWIDELDESKGSAEDVRERKIDARFASAPKMENDRPKTLLTDFEDIGLYLLPARGDDIAHGIQCINDLLNYDADRPVDFFNKPKLVISRECPNLIFALQTWTGKDGQKGATKDPIETLYRFATDECPYLGDNIEEGEDETSEFEPESRNHY